MKNFEHTHSSIPEDIAIKIASSLELPDLCSLGCCSRYWRELCGSEFIWEFLSKKRWPRFSVESNSRNPEIPLSSEGWREFYLKQHHELAIRTQPIVKFVEESSQLNSLEVNDYLKAIEEMSSIQLGFEDVQMLFFKPGLNVLLNLVGLHYCINYLQVPAAYVVEALGRCKISDRQVCVRWWKLGRWFYGFRMRDESHVRLICLADVANKEENVLAVLQRGAIHEVLRVQISVIKSTSIPWSSQSSEGMA